VLVASGDHEVLAALCHRVLVLRRGRVAAMLENAEVSASRIAEACSAVTDGVAGNVKGEATRDAN
jgi:ribose transport system ATP-binding protein